jgi:hypothetical protein
MHGIISEPFTLLHVDLIKHHITSYVILFYLETNSSLLCLLGYDLYVYGAWVQFVLFTIMCTLMKNKLISIIKLLRSQLWAVNNLKASNIRDKLINIIIKHHTWVLSTKLSDVWFWILSHYIVFGNITRYVIWMNFCTLIIKSGVNFFNMS